jgi:hypothetical protein
MFSSGFLTVLVYGALVWCAISSVALLAMLVRDLLQGRTW